VKDSSPEAVLVELEDVEGERVPSPDASAEPVAFADAKVDAERVAHAVDCAEVEGALERDSRELRAEERVEFADARRTEASALPDGEAEGDDERESRALLEDEPLPVSLG
jgi:hypothetical protein